MLRDSVPSWSGSLGTCSRGDWPTIHPSFPGAGGPGSGGRVEVRAKVCTSSGITCQPKARTRLGANGLPLGASHPLWYSVRSSRPR